MKETFEQGWLARPFKNQFPELSDAEANSLDDCNEAITLLYMCDLITGSQKDVIRQKKMPKLVTKTIAEARKRETTS